MKDIYEKFISKKIYKFEFITSSEKQDIPENYIKLELSRDNFRKFYTFIEKNYTNMPIEITIYDEGINNNLSYRETLLFLIKTLNSLNIKNITLILSDSTIPIYNNYMKILGWKHFEKTKLAIKIDRTSINREVKNLNTSEIQGKLNISEEKLLWLSNEQLEQLKGPVDEQILKNTIALKNIILFVDKYLKETYQSEKLSEYEKVYLIYELIKRFIRPPHQYIDIINDKEVLKPNHPPYISEPYGTWINQEGTCEGKARLMVALLNNPLIKINAITIDGESPQGIYKWVGIVIDGKLYQCCTTINGPFKNLEKLGYVIHNYENNEQIYPTIYEHAYLPEQEIKRIKRNVNQLKR